MASPTLRSTRAGELAVMASARDRLAHAQSHSTPLPRCHRHVRGRARPPTARSHRTPCRDPGRGPKRHDEGVERLQDWVRQPSIAAENRGMNEGCELMMRLAREAGFQTVSARGHRRAPGRLRHPRRRRAADGRALLHVRREAGRTRPSGRRRRSRRRSWTSPASARCVMGRGAVNQKGPEAAFLAALHAIRGAGRKPPVNLVLVAEGEEEIGSPHFRQVVQKPEVMAALKRCIGVFMPSAAQDPDGGGHGVARRQGCRRAGAGGERREVGARPQEGRPLEQPRAARQPGVPPGAGARHAGDGRRRSRRSTGSPTPRGRSRPPRSAMLDAAAARMHGGHGQAAAVGRPLGARPAAGAPRWSGSCRRPR